MYINKSQIVITIGVLLALIVAAAGAQERNSVAAVTATLLQYQGRLTDPATGAPLPDGSYTMVFRLYSAATAGTPLWTESKDVPVQEGLFSTALGSITPLDLGIFNGQALWLGVKVGTDEETAPRQLVMPVAYALSLVPGAEIQAESSSAALNVRNVGSGPALNVEGDLTVSGSLSGGAHNHAAADISSGTLAEPRIPSTIARDSEVAGFVSDHAADSAAHHGRYTDAEAVNAARESPLIVDDYSFYLHTSKPSAHHARYTDQEAVDAAFNSPDIVDSYWMGLHTADSSAHHSRYTNTEAVNAIKATDGSGSGFDADLLDGQHAGAFAAAVHSHNKLPIAYGLISNLGDVLSATSNVSSRFVSGNFTSHYEITIAGHNYEWANYVTVVTSLNSFHTPAISAADGKIIVYFDNSSMTSFYFVTFGY